MLRFEDFMEESQRATEADQLARLYNRAVSDEGYENCIFTSMRGRQLAHVAWFEFPEGYADAYIQNRWELIDPVLTCSLRALRPFFWHDVAKATTLTDDQLVFFEECRNLNVHSGIMFPFHGPNQRLDVMSISRRVVDGADPIRANFLHAISVQTWSRYQELTGEALFIDPDQRLTPRELEILKWCKDGKTRPEIGEILSITAKTVEFHLRNVMDKLGANNQISAVVIALQHRLIEL